MRAPRSSPYYAIDQAAAKLDLHPHALRARCRRAAVRQGRDIVAYLGGGVVASSSGEVGGFGFRRRPTPHQPSAVARRATLRYRLPVARERPPMKGISSWALETHLQFARK